MPFTPKLTWKTWYRTDTSTKCRIHPGLLILIRSPGPTGQSGQRGPDPVPYLTPQNKILTLSRPF